MQAGNDLCSGVRFRQGRGMGCLAIVPVSASSSNPDRRDCFAQTKFSVTYNVVLGTLHDDQQGRALARTRYNGAVDEADRAFSTGGMLGIMLRFDCVQGCLRASSNMWFWLEVLRRGSCLQRSNTTGLLSCSR